jgi:AcrR family transcriptional regulator
MSGGSLRVEFRRQVRERVLEAAHRHTVERGWERVRVGEVAVDSGVSRPTLYREFGNKDGLGEALMIREAERFFEAIAAVLREPHPDTGAAVAAATRLTLEEAEANPLLRAVLTGSRVGDAGLLPFLTTRSDTIRESGRVLIGDWLSAHEPTLDVAVVDEIVDAVVRLTISHLVAPSMPSDEVGERMARLVRRFVSD